MKKLIVLSILLMLIASVNVHGEEIIEYETGDSTFAINYETGDVRHRVIIKKDDISIPYEIHGNVGVYPLQLGDGEYEVMIYKHVHDSGYKLMYSAMINADTKENVFLQSVENINWNSEMDVIKQFDDMNMNEVYEYIVLNYNYNYDKINRIDASYYTDLNTLESDDMICLDYSVLYASVARSKGIPCKVVYGNAVFYDVLHAWNEIHVDGEWKIVDLTLGNEYLNKGWKLDMYQDEFFYEKIEEY